MSTTTTTDDGDTIEDIDHAITHARNSDTLSDEMRTAFIDALLDKRIRIREAAA
jgi:hypothetical protein